MASVASFPRVSAYLPRQTGPDRQADTSWGTRLPGLQRLPHLQGARERDVAITLDTYSHMLPGMSSEAADAIAEALG